MQACVEGGRGRGTTGVTGTTAGRSFLRKSRERRSAAPSALGDHRLPFASRAGLFPPPLPPLSRLRARRQGISTTERSHCSIASPNPFSCFFFFFFWEIVVPETHNQAGARKATQNFFLRE